MFKKIFAVVVALFLLTATVVAFDSTHGKFKEFEEDRSYYLSRSVVNIYTFGSAMGSVPVYNSKTNKIDLIWQQGIFDMQGTGFVVKSQKGKLYIITAAHVIEPATVSVPSENPASYFITRSFKIIQRIIFIGDTYSPYLTAEIVWTDLANDMAILELNAPSKRLAALEYNTSYTFSTSDPNLVLKIGDAVSVLVSQRDEEGQKTWLYELRSGKIENIYATCSMPQVLPWFNVYDVTIDVPLIPGDSGSPVFVYQNGTPVIVGIARAIFLKDKEVHYYFTRIDEIKRWLDTD
jgi:S1-C subfamily serine protease